jgi:mRNA interferase MazF
VLSADAINHGPSELVTIVPITTKGRNLRSFLRIDPPEGGLPQTSFIICDQVRTISVQRLTSRYGAVGAATLLEVERRIRFLLDFR